VGLSTNDPNKFQSYHAAHVLILADEAQGILSNIWEAVEGIRAGGDVRVLMQGNPRSPAATTRTPSPQTAPSGRPFTISAFDHAEPPGSHLEQLLAMSDDELSISAGALLW